MSKESRRELLAVVAPRYRACKGAERKGIVEEFVASTGYNRKYAIHLLNHPPRAKTPRKQKQGKRRYGGAVQDALTRCWRATNGICSKRLVPYLPELVQVLERTGELHLDRQTKADLLALSTATATPLTRFASSCG